MGLKNLFHDVNKRNNDEKKWMLLNIECYSSAIFFDSYIYIEE